MSEANGLEYQHVSAQWKRSNAGMESTIVAFESPSPLSP